MYYYNQMDYDNVKYDNKSTPAVETIRQSGCGPVSACIAINNIEGRELYTVKSMTQLSLDSGARDNSGTNMSTLLKAICKKHSDLSFTTTNDESKVVSHLKKGGIAIANQGEAYNVFSSAGHFVVLYKMAGNDIDVLDPQMYDGKYDQYSRPQRIVKKTTDGCIVSVKELAKATSDRNPAYFLISYDKPKPVKVKAPSFKKGAVYTLTANVNVRSAAGTDNKIKKVKDLTADGKKNCTSKDLNADAVLKKGTRVTAKKVIKKGNDIWIEIPSGCIAAYYQGKQYVK